MTFARNTAMHQKSCMNYSSSDPNCMIETTRKGISLVRSFPIR